MAQLNIVHLAKSCSEIANGVCEPDGFVALRKLVQAFQAELIKRPLLVEGMLAVPRLNSSTLSQESWKVLIDSETYSYSESEFEHESSSAPLHNRLRNTVAHELVHALEFRATGSGFQLSSAQGNGAKDSLSNRDLEQETEKLSPLLLISETALQIEFRRSPAEITLSQLEHFRTRMGISRQVFISRLNLFDIFDPGMIKECFRNTALGIAEWTENSELRFLEWPLFFYFDREVPQFIVNLKKRIHLDLRQIFDDKDFVINGGNKFEVTAEIPAGTFQSPNRLNMHVLISIEACPANPGRKCVFFVKEITPLRENPL